MEHRSEIAFGGARSEPSLSSQQRNMVWCQAGFLDLTVYSVGPIACFLFVTVSVPIVIDISSVTN